MKRRAGEHGEGRLGLLIALAVVGVGIFLGVKVIPVKVNAYEFGDFIQQECRFAAVRNKDAEVAKRIYDKAAELEIPLKKQDLKIQRTANEMIISCAYDQPIDLKVTTYVYKFRTTERAPRF